MAKTIEFTHAGSCNALGNFAPGGIARNIPDDLADHLVNEAQCAKYWVPRATAPAAAPWPPEQAPTAPDQPSSPDQSPEPEKAAKPPRKAKAKDEAK